MNTPTVLRVLFILVATSRLTALADPVTEWNSIALNAIKAGGTSPPQAARHLAVLHVSIFDACNGIGQNCEPYFISGKPAGVASKEAAIAAAAHRILVGIYPSQQEGFDSFYERELGEISDGPAKSVGIAWGDYVANTILRLRSNDGSDRVLPYTPASGPGAWIPTPPAFAPALLPNWPFIMPFAMNDGAQFRPPPPPALGSAEWAADFNLTKELGRADSATRTAEQTAVARFWADGAGTVTPPGHWNVIARDVATQRGATLEQNARLFALLNIALADAGIVSWDAKYVFNFWRPVTAVRDADSDGNPDTASDPTWTPLLITPPFPEYISGHSTFSGAAATVLAVFFGSDAVSFTTTSEDLPGTSRHFNSFSEAAEEAGMSRIYGGIHFMSANRNGLQSGADLAGYVTEHFLRPEPGSSQRGR